MTINSHSENAMKRAALLFALLVISVLVACAENGTEITVPNEPDHFDSSAEYLTVDPYQSNNFNISTVCVPDS